MSNDTDYAALTDDDRDALIAAMSSQHLSRANQVDRIERVVVEIVGREAGLAMSWMAIEQSRSARAEREAGR